MEDWEVSEIPPALLPKNRTTLQGAFVEHGANTQGVVVAAAGRMLKSDAIP